MPSIQTLREQKAEKVNAARAISEKIDFTAEDQKQFDTLKAEAEAIEQRIKNQQDLEGLGSAQDVAAFVAQGNAAGRIEVGRAEPVYKNLGEQLLDVMAMKTDNKDAPKARERFEKVVNAAGATTGVDAEGGYLVETDKAKDILTTSIETGVLSRRCISQPISASADSYHYLSADDRDRSTGKRNGVGVFRKSEVEEMKISGWPKLKERELRVEDMYGYLRCSNRMLRDAVALAEYAKRCLREQFAFRFDLEIFQGTGTGQCLGIMNSDLPVTVSKETNQTADTIVAENVVKMLARFYGDITKAAWFVNLDCLPQLPFMKIGDQPVFVPGGSFANAPFGALLGIPIAPIEFCKTLGDKGDIILGDFSQYQLVTKGGMEEAESMHVHFLTDEMAFRFITRNNGQPLHDSPITPLNGSNTLSPFVMLEAR